MILSVGEILVDMIGKPNNEGTTIYERKAGGAPFNVCAAINRLEGHADFLGSVGKDNMGSFLLDFMSKENIDTKYVSVLDDYNTTLAFVELDKEGERSFCFYRKNTSDIHLVDLDDELIKKYNIIHFGSLMLSSDEGRTYLLKNAKKVKENGVLLSFDINFRDDIFSSKEEAIKIYKEIIPLFDILKISSEEIEIFTEEYVDSLTNKLIFISLGKQGSICKYDGKKYHGNTVVVKSVDTTGAGDAFYGASLKMIDEVGSDNLDSENIINILKYANIVGALTTLGYGAIDPLPSKTQIKEFMDNYDF